MIKHYEAIQLIKKEIAILTSIATNSQILSDESENDLVVDINISIASLNGSVEALLTPLGTGETKVKLVATDLDDGAECVSCYYSGKKGECPRSKLGVLKCVSEVRHDHQKNHHYVEVR